MSGVFDAGWKPTVLWVVSIFPARAGFLSGVRSYCSRRTFSECSGGNIVAVAAAVVAATVMFSGCAPVYAKGAPLSTPDLHGTNGTDGTNL